MAKKKAKRTWIYSPKKPTPPTVPDDLKAEVEARANELIETQLTSRFINHPPEDQRWNYLTGISTKWHRSFFYFVGDYASPGPNALSPTFESRFARMEYVGDGKFNLAYMRHTGKWWEVSRGLTAEECLERIGDEAIFQP